MSRRRRRRREDRQGESGHDDHNRWLVSYADFITLLFAFFVVMYSLSSINEGKYRLLSDSIVQAFRNLSVNEGGEFIELPPVLPVQPIVPPRRDEGAEARRRQAAARMHGMAEEIRRVLAPLTRAGRVNVSEGAFGISVEINASLLFAPGDAALGAGAVTALRAVAQVLAPVGFPITVEGHTDNLPIRTYRYPSNWELSAVRASSVARLFIDSGVAPDRLTAAGYADQRPVADNGSEEGRARNRRVTILIESRADELPASGPGIIAPDDPIRTVLPAPPAGPGAD